MSNIQLANNLRFLRKLHGLTQDTLSDMLSISRQAYSNYETNKRTPDLDTLLYLARLYKTSLDELVLGNIQSGYGSDCDCIAEDITPYILTKNKKTDNTIYLTDTELELITLFRSASDPDRQLIIGFLSRSNQS